MEIEGWEDKMGELTGFSWYCSKSTCTNLLKRAVVFEGENIVYRLCDDCGFQMILSDLSKRKGTLIEL
jgi:hypothetical protein